MPHHSYATPSNMTSALLCINRQMTAPTLLADLQAAGVSVGAMQADVTKLVRDVAVHAPDLVICDVPLPTSSWFQSIHMLQQAVPCPLLVFTSDTDADNIQKSIESGIHVYVVNGYSGSRLRALIQLAQSRFTHAQQQRKAFEELATRFEERKAVDRAKGILMRNQHLSDDDAFRVLRSTAMRSNQRMGQLSQHVIHSAHYADAVNRSGQLRMLSQRLVKLYSLCRAQVDAQVHAALLQESIQWIDDNFAHLRGSLSSPTFGDLLGQVAACWAPLKLALAQQEASSVNDCAEALLLGAERLTASLEVSGFTPSLRLLNLAGRQRMLSQRFAKYALLASAAPSTSADLAHTGMREAQQEFESALTYLNGLPLSSPAIQDTLRDAGVAWMQMVAAAKALTRTDTDQRNLALLTVARESETLLQRFEQLAEQYEHSLDMLVG